MENKIVKEFFIKDWDKRYSINENGEVWSNYRFRGKGKKIYRRMLVTAHFHLKLNPQPIVGLCKGTKGRKIVFMKSLMAQYFKLTPPDTYHKYCLINKDGNLLNNSLSNLEWKISLTKEWDFYPQPFYDKKGNIIEKICGNCGVKLDIKRFQLQNLAKRAHYETFRNECIGCFSSRNWKNIKANPILHEKSKKKARIHNALPTTKIKEKIRAKKDRDTLSLKYLKHSLCSRTELTRSDLTPEIIELQKKSLTFQRIKKLIKTKN